MADHPLLLPAARPQDDEDEYLHVMAQQLGKLVELVGGAEHAACLLGPLELLACAEDAGVRKAAVESLSAVLSRMSDMQLVDAALPVLHRLAANKWYTGRMSACQVLPLQYHRFATDVQVNVMQWLQTLCSDEVPVVRKALCLGVGHVAKHMSPTAREESLLGMLERFIRDEQDSVRSQVIAAVALVAESTPPLLQGGRLLQATLQVGADESWRVRWTFADKICELCRVFNPELSQGAFCQAFASLLVDPEPEVRVMAAERLAGACDAFTTEQVLEHILPNVQQVVADDTDFVRKAAAARLPWLAPKLGREVAVGSVLPLVNNLLRDANNEVRLGVVTNLKPLHEAVGLALLSDNLLPTLRELAEAPSWRTRLEVVSQGATLAKQLGESAFNDQLCETALRWLLDDVHAVREAAAENLLAFLDMFGGDWAAAKLMPTLTGMATHSSYSRRLTACAALLKISKSAHARQLMDAIMAQALALAEDRVANVRINAADTLAVLAEVDAGYRNGASRMALQSLAVLERLGRDSDSDVKHAATRARLRIMEVQHSSGRVDRMETEDGAAMER